MCEIPCQLCVDYDECDISCYCENSLKYYCCLKYKCNSDKKYYPDKYCKYNNNESKDENCNQM